MSGIAWGLIGIKVSTLIDLVGLLASDRGMPSPLAGLAVCSLRCGDLFT